MIINKFALIQIAVSIAETDSDHPFRTLKSVKTLKISGLVPILKRYLTTN